MTEIPTDKVNSPRDGQSSARISVAVSIAAFCVSVLALCISWLQYEDSHKQVVAQDNPQVTIETDSDTADLPVGVNITNPGPSIVHIQGITYYMDRKRIGSVVEFVDAAQLGQTHYGNLPDGMILEVGRKIWLLSMIAKPAGKDGQKNLDHLADIVGNHLGVEITVCSQISTKCNTSCSTDGWCG